MRGMTCTGKCQQPEHIATNFHAAWDEGLINKTVWNWGAYVERLENGWLKSADAKQTGIDGGTPEDWANETHKVGQTVWKLRRTDNVLDDRYYSDVLPLLDRQLGVAGLRLARFLTQAYGASQCPVQ